MIKKLLAGVFIFMFIFTTAVTPVNVSAAENYNKTAQQLDNLAYDGDDLGSVYTKESTSFKVWAPTASKVSLNIYTTGSDDEEGAKKVSAADMSFDSGSGVWSTIVQGDLAGMYYTYSVTVNGKTNETVDIYAKAAGVNGNRGMVVDLDSTDPDGWDDDKNILVKNQTDAIVWEVHIKDFSNQADSGISAKNRGKYLAFTETGTVLSGTDIPTGIDYLKKLGVTHVQINPFFDFGSVDESNPDDKQYNWGYDPKNYNVPEGSYSSNPYDGNVRINETKQMIKALHDAGIGVIMDVVYNHTHTGEDSFFNLTVPNYYYRFTEDGSWSNGSACTNDTASEHAMYRKFMVDSVYYWAKEYHIDGFRFDLMGLHDTDTMNAIRSELDKLDERIIMYGEAWNMDTNTDAALATQNNMSLLNDRIAAFNDGIRDALKGDNFLAKGKGFIQGENAAVRLHNGIKGAADSWAKAPCRTVTYASCHDNFTLYDKLVASVKESGANYRSRYDDLVNMNKLGAAVILTSQGMPFMLAGEEMARSKDGDDNSFVSSPALNQIDWNNLKLFGDLTSYYAGLIQIRKNFAPFCDPGKTTIDNMKIYENTDSRVLAYMIDNKLTAGSQWNKAVCIFNSDTENDKTITLEGENLPDKWVVIANGDKAGVTSLGEVSGNTVEVLKSSALILVDKDSFDRVKTEADSDFKDMLYDEAQLTVIDESGAEITLEAETKDTAFDWHIPAIVGGAVAAGAVAGAIIYKIKKSKK